MSNPQVLLVDANRDGLDLYSAALALAGIRTTTASSAGEALAQIEASTPDAVVTGLRLPGTGGTELIRKIRRQAVRPGIFIVALTTNARAEAPGAREAGCDVVLKVPCLPETLIAELRRALP